MKFLAIILTALALTGCVHKAPELTTRVQKISEKTTAGGYAAELRGAVQYRMYDIAQWAGKSCVLQIDMQRNGIIKGVKMMEGDPTLCQAAIKAVQGADIPAPATDEIYNKVKNAKLDFKL